MAPTLPIPSPRAILALRHTLLPRTPTITSQIRHATLLRRPKRPYTFTQLVTLSDGSSFTVRTTSPQAVYKSAKDIRNAPLWNPSSQKLLNVEEDEAGRLAAFRSRFGRGWDAEGDATGAKDTGKNIEGGKDGKEGAKVKTGEDHLMDLISGMKAPGNAKEPTRGKQIKPQAKVEEKK